MSLSKSVVLSHDLLGVNQRFYRGHLRPLECTDICIMINNGSKITVIK